MPNNSQNLKISNIAIGILFLEKVDQTIECIDSFLPSRIPIVVCNNGSTPASRQKIIDHIAPYSNVQLIDAESNLGVSGGRNLIIRSTTAPWLFFVDNDITVQTRDWLHKFQKHVQQFPDAEAFIPQLYNVFERTYSPRNNIKILDDKVSFTKRVTGNALNMFPGGASLVKRSLFDRIGIYDEKMFVNYEDYELSLRGVVSGRPVQAHRIDDIVLRHDHRRVSSESDRAYVAARYDHDRTRSSVQRIFEKYHLRIQEDSASWSETQKNSLLRGRKWWSKGTLFFFIPASIKRLWNHRR